MIPLKTNDESIYRYNLHGFWHPTFYNFLHNLQNILLLIKSGCDANETLKKKNFQIFSFFFLEIQIRPKMQDKVEK